MKRVTLERYDLVVVGSGLIGAVVCREVRLLAPAARILVVDAAPVVGSVPGVHLRWAETADARSAYRRYASAGWGRGPSPTDAMYPVLANAGVFGHDVSRFPGAMLSWNVGGMGSHWAGAAPAPDGQEVPTFIAPQRWNCLIRRAAEALRVSSDHDAVWGDDEALTSLRAEFPSTVTRGVRPMPMAGTCDASGVFRPTAAVDVFAELARPDADRTSLASDTMCTAVEVEGDVCRRVHLRHLPTGQTAEVGAACVVVAADALRTPQLLFASGLRPPALGRWLNEHVMVRAVFPRHETAPRTGEPRMGAWWVPSDSGRRRLSGQVTAARAPGGALTHYELNWFSRTNIKPDNRLEFGGVDLVGMPAMTIHYALDAEDEEGSRLARQNLGRAAAALSAPDDVAVEIMPSGLSLHYTGTLRVGPVDDGTSVAAPDGRVWGTRNLYVAGNGAIPTAMTCNTTLTAAALAVETGRSVCRLLSSG